MKEHGFFGGIDWVALYAKKLAPPSKPVVAGPLDMSNYEKCDENFAPSAQSNAAAAAAAATAAHAAGGSVGFAGDVDHPAFADWSTRGDGGGDGELAPMVGARRGSILWKSTSNLVKAASAFRRPGLSGLM